jgi:hypothetical protein
MKTQNNDPDFFSSSRNFQAGSHVEETEASRKDILISLRQSPNELILSGRIVKTNRCHAAQFGKAFTQNSSRFLD